MQKKKQSKIIDGRFQLGIVTDWIMRHEKLSAEAKILYISIATHSLNMYHKRYVNIGKDKLPFKSRRLYKYRDELADLNLIGWKTTRAYTMFWLKEPNYNIRNFIFKNDKADSEAEVKKLETSEEIEFDGAKDPLPS